MSIHTYERICLTSELTYELANVVLLELSR